MTIWAVASGRGSPGATCLAMGLAAAWGSAGPSRPVVIEADPDGGVLAARFDELRVDRSLADLAVAARRGSVSAALFEIARPVWGGLPVVAGHPGAEHSTAVLTNAGERIALSIAADVDLHAVIDVGRLTSRSPALPLAQHAAATLLVSRTRFEDVAVLVTRAREMRAVGVNPFLVTVGNHPYDPGAVAEETALPLLATMPDDTASAAVLAGEGRADGRLRRSLLWRTIGDLASRVPALASGGPTEGRSGGSASRVHDEVPSTAGGPT